MASPVYLFLHLFYLPSAGNECQTTGLFAATKQHVELGITAHTTFSRGRAPHDLDQRLEPALLRCVLQELSLERVPADEREDGYGLGLPDLLYAVLCLQIHLRVQIQTLRA